MRMSRRKKTELLKEVGDLFDVLPSKVASQVTKRNKKKITDYLRKEFEQNMTDVGTKSRMEEELYVKPNAPEPKVAE